MEVIVSAAVLLIVVLGVLAAMDSVAKTAGVNKAKTVAATLAENDQERLRGLHMDTIGAPMAPYDVSVAGVKYVVQQKAVWVTDGSDEEVSCGATNSEGSYVRLTSTVTSPMTGAQLKPVVLSSIMAPRQKGALVVIVKNAAEQPVQGLTVTAPPLAPKVTNSAGCAVFSQIDAGNYTVGLNQTGWVDWNGNTVVTKLAGVTAGNVTTVEFAYDRAATATVTVQNKPTAQGGVLEPAMTVLGAHPKPTTGMRKTTSFTVNAVYPSGTAAIHSVANLFPFPEGYTFYSGGCLGADPSKQVANYFSTYPGQGHVRPGRGQGGHGLRAACELHGQDGKRCCTHQCDGVRVPDRPRLRGCADSDGDVVVGRQDGLHGAALRRLRHLRAVHEQRHDAPQHGGDQDRQP